jgi:steroid 5-alpha reductase family enzyme
MLRERTGRWYPFINFTGIHMVPTLIVYLCISPVIYCIENHVDGGLMSTACLFICFGAVLLQAAADHQMHLFRKDHHGELIRTGLWAYSRHPNYLGEILMWWGIGLSAMIASRGGLSLLFGAAVNTCLFLFVSIPMAEERQSSKPGFEEYRSETRMLLPIRKEKAADKKKVH